MALLNINGVPLEATATEWEPVRLGSVVRSLNGSARSTARVRKADFRYTTSLLTIPEALAIRGLVDGDGHVLSFEDSSSSSAWLYTSGEVPPTSSSGAVRSSSLKKWGSYGLLMPAGTVPLSWNLGFENTGGTFMGWVKEGTGPWRHIIYSSDLGLYVDGVLAGDEYLFGYVTASGVTLGDLEGAGIDAAYDDVVALPYNVPATWAPVLYAFHSSRPWPTLPYLHASGDPRFPPAGLTVRGETAAGRNGPLRTSLSEVFDFTLFRK